ncbi:MAG: hypothetical protein K0S66_2265 [Sphingomonas sp.]|jgi:hypothetical protein|nr:hypothetical protein [Sphingomonas sp.]MDF2495331.1 hypothetical protein [Sphingomonas sp.]
MDEATIQASDDATEASTPSRGAGTDEPRQGAFNDPAPGQNDKARQIGAPDDFDRQLINVRDCRFELLSDIPAIGEQLGEGGQRFAGSLNQISRPVAVLNIGAVHHAFQHVAERAGYDVPLAPLDLLAGVVSPWPTRLPCSNR